MHRLLTRASAVLGAVGVLVVLVTSVACSPKPDADSTSTKTDQPSSANVASPAKPPADRTANEILQQLSATYRQAKTYRDNGVVRLSFRRGSQPFAEDAPAAVVFERPNKLSIVAYQATVKSDGKELKARIEDPLSNNLDRQIVVRPAPSPIKLADLADDRLLYDLLGSRLGRQPIQLELLLESSGLVGAFSSDVACQRLNDATHGGRTCFRVEVSSAAGPLTFWVDQADFLLRRLDFPAAALVADLANDSTVANLELYADLREAKINDSIPVSQFALDVPASAKRMKRFARPPQPLPSKLIGRQPQSYYFTRLDGGRASDKDLSGKTTVLAWYHDDPACEATLQQVSAARQKLASNNDAAFFAVATDPTSASNDAIQRRLQEWQVELPIVRDLEAFGDKSFHIEVHPAIIVLDRGGRVQHFQPGGSPELADQLVAMVERLNRGDDLAAESLAQHTAGQRRYDELVARGGPEADELLDIPEAVIRRPSEPKKLQLKPLWTLSELKHAGNILMAETPDQPPRIFVFDGPRTIDEISADGKVIAKHALQIPEQAAVTLCRTATDRQGERWFVASAPLAPQLFVFDSEWKLRLSFPPPDHAPLAVFDLALVDLDEKHDAPEILVANANGAGIAALSLTGEVRWRNRSVANALSSAVPPSDEFGSLAILVAGELPPPNTGAVLRINRFGNEESPVKVANWPIGRILATSLAGSNDATLLGLTSNAKMEPFVVGLTSKLEERWNYPLPPGVHQQPIEPIQSSRVLAGHAGEWWIAGPDGSIHVITTDGQLFDSFHYGTPLTGLAAGRMADRPTLLVATAKGLAAWEVSLPTATKSKREY